MNDLISRQAAIDALKNRWKKTRNYEGNGDDIAEECELYLKQVPSAQPEIIRCKDCKYFDPLTEDFDYNFCDAWAGGTNENMFCGFAERRQDADSSGNMSGTQKELKCTETHECVYQRTGTHEPQRMRGKWIDQKGGGCCCSECGRYALDEPDGNFIHVAVKSNYCPNCGADMRWT